MSLDTTTLTETNIPNIAARNVESRIKTFLDGLKVLTEQFFAAQGIEADFYSDGTGAHLSLSSDTTDLLSPLVEDNASTGFPAAWWTAEEDRLNSNIESVYADMPDPVIGVGHS